MPVIRDRSVLLTYAGLLAVTAGAWVSLLRSPMSGDDMAGMQMVMRPTVADALAYVVAWGVMMAAMMLPSALPMIGLYAATVRNDRALVRATAIAAFSATYLGLWAVSGVPVYFTSLGLMAVTPATLAYVAAGVLVLAGVFQLSPLKQVCLRHCRSPFGFFMGHWRGGWRGGLAMGWAHACYCLGCCWALMVVLVAAGVFQLSPLKQVCLRHCRSPLGFLLAHWRDGYGGASRMGAVHGMWCVGCCWALMIVLVVAGAMGLPWVLLIACVVAAEKLLPGGEWMARAIGVVLVGLGVAVAMYPELASALRMTPA